MDKKVKRIFVFILWYSLMASFTLPVGWYIFSYSSIDIEMSESIMILIPCTIFILSIISERFMEMIVYIITFPFRTLDELDSALIKRKIKIYSKRKYIKIKNKA